MKLHKSRENNSLRPPPLGDFDPFKISARKNPIPNVCPLGKRFFETESADEASTLLHDNSDFTGDRSARLRPNDLAFAGHAARRWATDGPTLARSRQDARPSGVDRSGETAHASGAN